MSVRIHLCALELTFVKMCTDVTGNIYDFCNFFIECVFYV